jgi:hypothetical protein
VASNGIEVRYSSNRGEIWRWYMQAWRKRLWMFHLAVAALVFLLALYFQAKVSEAGPAKIAISVAAAIISIGFMVAYPQLAFKAQERRLLIDPSGMETSIRSRTRRYARDKVAGIVDLGDTISITLRNMNAFVVPRRAFASNDERANFLDAARNWSGQQPSTGGRALPRT